MTINEIERRIETVTSTVDRNVDLKCIQGQIATGVWECALQIARLVEAASIPTDVEAR